MAKSASYVIPLSPCGRGGREERERSAGGEGSRAIAARQSDDLVNPAKSHARPRGPSSYLRAMTLIATPTSVTPITT